MPVMVMPIWWVMGMLVVVAAAGVAVGMWMRPVRPATAARVERPRDAQAGER